MCFIYPLTAAPLASRVLEGAYTYILYIDKKIQRPKFQIKIALNHPMTYVKLHKNEKLSRFSIY